MTHGLVSGGQLDAFTAGELEYQSSRHTFFAVVSYSCMVCIVRIVCIFCIVV